MQISRIAIFSTALGLLCIALGCQKSPTPAQIQIMKVLELGSKLNTATEVGLSYEEFKSSLLEYVGALDLAVEMWPKDLSLTAKQSLLDSKKVWLFTMLLWKDKVDSSRYKNITVLGISQALAESRISELPEKARERLSLTNGDRLGRKKEDGDEHYDAKHLSFESIGTTLDIAGKDFISARKEITAYFR